MIAFKKSIFTIVAFLVVLTSFGFVPQEASAVSGGDVCNIRIDDTFGFNKNPPRVNGVLDLGDEIGGATIYAFQATCNSAGQVTQMKYWSKKDNSGLGTGDTYFEHTQGYDVSGSRTTGLTQVGSGSSGGVVGSVTQATQEAIDNLWTKIIAGVNLAAGKILGFLASGIMFINYTVVGLGGLLFETAMGISVEGINTYLGDTSPSGQAIAQSWSLFKDLSNLVFIFLILYIAIKIIINGNGLGDKRLLGGIIVVALFMNFSLLATKVAIDLSNSVSVILYNQITGDGANPIGASITAHMNLTTFVGSDDIQKLETVDSELVKGMIRYLMAILATPFFLITGLGFAIGGCFLVWRMILFIYLMILSPLAFVTSVIPGARGFSSKWLNMLVSQCLFLPVMLICLYLTLILSQGIEGAVVDTSAKFSDLYNVLTGVFSDSATNSADVLAEIIAATTAFAQLTINYLIIMTTLLFAIFGSRKVGLSSASWASAVVETKSRGAKHVLRPASSVANLHGTAIKQGSRRVAGATLRPIIARPAEKIAGNTKLNTLANQNGIKGYFGRKGLGVANSLKNAGGLQDVRKATEEKFESRYEALGKKYGKEQKVQNDRDVAKYAHGEAVKKLSATKKQIKDIGQEEEKIYKQLMDGLGYDDASKDVHFSLESEIKDFEKKKKKGTLSAADNTAFDLAKKQLEDNKQRIRSAAAGNSSIDSQITQRATALSGEKTRAHSDMVKHSTDELTKGNVLKAAEKELHKVDTNRKNRQKEFAKTVSAKTKFWTGSYSRATQEAAKAFENKIKLGTTGKGGDTKKT